MATHAKVESLEALQRLRAAIIRFTEVVGAVVADASSDVNRTMQWLELDRARHWETERRKRHEQLQQALEALRMKRIFKGPAGERPSTVDEEKRVKVCRAALEEAENKLRAVAAHRTRLSREALLFQGVLSRLGAIAVHDGPAAAAELSNLMLALEKYGTLAVVVGSQATSPAAAGTPIAGELSSAMSRGAAVGEVGGHPAGQAPSPVNDAVEGQATSAAKEATSSGDALKAAGAPTDADNRPATDWSAVRKRAREAWRWRAEPVVVERGAAAAGAGPALVFRDFLRGRVFVTPVVGDPMAAVGDSGAASAGVTAASADAFEGWTLERLLSWSPGLESALSSPGDVRAVVEDGGRVVTVVNG
ncbi:MAG: hypothetical protein ACK4PI_04435 [Tepidisphaerales bacterium]